MITIVVASWTVVRQDKGSVWIVSTTDDEYRVPKELLKERTLCEKDLIAGILTYDLEKEIAVSFQIDSITSGNVEQTSFWKILKAKLNKKMTKGG